jgi:hypothetical protein
VYGGASISYAYIGQRYISNNYYVYRGLLSFNLTYLSGTISNATLKFTGSIDFSTTDFNILLVEYTEDEIDNNTTCFNAYGSTTFGSINSSSYSDTKDNMTITLNANGITYMNDYIGDKCLFMLVSDRDINETQPTGNEFIKMYANNNDIYSPRIDITYTGNIIYKPTTIMM